MPKKKIRRTPLEKLERAWSKAEWEEKQAFLLGIGVGIRPITDVESHSRAPRGGSISTGRYLTEDAVTEIERQLKARSMTLADLNRRLGLAEDDRSLARALYRKSCLRLVIIARLGTWLETGL